MQLLEARDVKIYDASSRIALWATVREAGYCWFYIILAWTISIMSLPLLSLWWKIESDFPDCFFDACGCHPLRKLQRDVTALLSLCVTWELDFWGTAKPSTQHFSGDGTDDLRLVFEAFMKSWLLNHNVPPCTCSVLEGFNGFFTKVLYKAGEQIWVYNHWASPSLAVAWNG